jgi:hypothetical protein
VKISGDVQDIARDLGFKQLGMRSLLAATHNMRLSKGLQVSDWQQMELPPKYDSTQHVNFRLLASGDIAVRGPVSSFLQILFSCELALLNKMYMHMHAYQ